MKYFLIITMFFILSCSISSKEAHDKINFCKKLGMDYELLYNEWTYDLANVMCVKKGEDEN